MAQLIDKRTTSYYRNKKYYSGVSSTWLGSRHQSHAKIPCESSNISDNMVVSSTSNWVSLTKQKRSFVTVLMLLTVRKKKLLLDLYLSTKMFLTVDWCTLLSAARSTADFSLKTQDAWTNSVRIFTKKHSQNIYSKPPRKSFNFSSASRLRWNSVK